MNNPKIIGLGLASLDIIIQVEDTDLAQTTPTILDTKIKSGGTIGYALAVASKLGAHTRLVGTAGNDITANLKLKNLVKAGLDVSRVLIRSSAENQIIIVYANATTLAATFVLPQNIVSNTLRPEELDQQYITEADCLLLDGFHLDAAICAAHWMKQVGKGVILTLESQLALINQSEISLLLKYTDVLISSANLTSKLSRKTDIVEAGKYLLGCGPSVVIQTTTDSPTIGHVTTRDSQFYMPALELRSLATIAENSAFSGGYITGYVHNLNIRESILFGAAVQNLVANDFYREDAPPKYTAIIEYLREHHCETHSYTITKNYNLATMPQSPQLVMLKPDVYTKPLIGTSVAQDLVMGLVDILEGNVELQKYSYRYYGLIARSILSKHGKPLCISNQQRNLLKANLLRLAKDLNTKDTKYVLEKFILDILYAVGFEVIDTIQCKLTEEWIRKLYPRLNKTDFVKGPAWEKAVIASLQEDDVKFLLIDGVLGYTFINCFKDLIRYSLRDWANHNNQAVQNILHVPEPNELERTLDLVREIQTYEKLS